MKSAVKVNWRTDGTRDQEQKNHRITPEWEATIAKVLKTAALVVGAAALVASGIGAAGGLGLLGTSGTFLGVSAATFTTVGTLAGVGAAILAAGAALSTPKGSLAGSATKFTIDKESGIPVVFGRTYVGGRVVHRQYYGPKNSFESWVTILSLGLVNSIGPLLIDKTTPAVIAGVAQGQYAGYMWLDEQRGATPETRALAGPQGDFPGWDATSKLSGLAADLWTLKFDSKGKVYPNGVPERGRILEGMMSYDGRLDSTYPGGSGPCRIGQEETYVYSENPSCNAVTWAYGRIQNGTLVAGGGLKVTGFNMAPFVEWSNVCDANNWKVGGTVFTDTDNTWDVLQMIAQAGGAEVMPVGALLSCTFNAPRVSIGRITSADIAGDVVVPSTTSRRTRRNTVIPKVNLESHGWAMTPLDAISIPDYVAVDGGKRPLPIDMPLVQQVDQGAQLGLYALFNGRELDGISLPAKVYLLGYLPGDCVTVDIPEAALVERDVVIRNRELDGATAGVTFTCRTETAAKHPFSLGHSGSAPRTPDLTPPVADTSPPSAGDWTLTGAALAEGGASIPALSLTGAVTSSNAEAVIFEYRAAGTTDWTMAGTDPATTTARTVSSVAPGGSYEAAVRYRVRGVVGDRLVLGPVTAGSLTVPSVATADSATTAESATTAGTVSDGSITYTPAQIKSLQNRLDALDGGS